MFKTTEFVSPTTETQTECHAWFEDVLDAVFPGWIAGGSLRDYFSRTPCTSDIDVFFRNELDLADGIDGIERAGAKPLYDHPNIRGYLLNGKHVQLVKNRFFETMEDTIDEFDFTVCSAAINYEGRVVMHPRFLEDLAAQRLVLHRCNSPGGTLARLSRYAEKGFVIDKGMLLQIATAIRSPLFDETELDDLAFYSSGVPRYGLFPAVTSRDEESALRRVAHSRLQSMLVALDETA